MALICQSVNATDKTNLYITKLYNYKKDNNIMATNNDSTEVVSDTDKEKLMEIRGIIDGVIDSGSTDYNGALQQIHDLMAGK